MPEDAVAPHRKIESRSQLIYALIEVAELEHLLMCQYLFAAASLKTHPEELSCTARRYHQVELIREWKRGLLRVAREEMQHLAYANNLLIAVGGAPYFGRPNFPCAKRFYKSGPDDPGLEMSLERFGPDVIDRFIRFETSEVERRFSAAAVDAIPDPNYYETLHEFYTAIREALVDGTIIDVEGQYEPIEEYERVVDVRRRLPGDPARPASNIVRNAAEARALIDEIMLQGEGAPGDVPDPRAHVNIFRKMKEELGSELAADPDFEPSRRVVPNPLTRLHDDIPPRPCSPVTVIPEGSGDGLAHALLQLFAGAYQVQVAWLQQIFGRRGPARERRAIETLVFLPFMSEVIRPLSEILTQVPVARGRADRLGATFEVTTNNYLLPSDQLTARRSIEAIRELAAEAKALTGRLDAAGHGEAARQIGEVGETLRLLQVEVASRAEHGWPLDFGWPRRTGPFRPDGTYSEAGGGSMMRSAPAPVLELEFRGWFQCRLATDPDGAFIRRGVTGNTFATGDEPDLDRVIRFQPEGTVTRSHCPAVGVTVTAARLLASALHAPRTGTPVPGLVGAKVRLLGEPRFEGRNHLVSEDGEPIDPFDLEVRGEGGLRLRRKAIGIPINDMTPQQRRGTGRYPIGGAQVLLSAMRNNLERMGDVDSPQDLVRDRIARLEREYAAVPAEERLGGAAVALLFRLRILREIGWNIPNVRWTRFFFDCEYLHTLGGDMEVELDGVEPAFRVLQASGDSDPRWLVHYHFGFYDTDALAAYAHGLLRVPVALD